MSAAQAPRNPQPPRNLRPALTGFAIWGLVSLICFAAPLWRWASFALDSDLFSHILLIPFVSAYLIWWNKASLRLGGKASPLAAVSVFLCATGMLTAYFLLSRGGTTMTAETSIALTMYALLLFLLSGVLLFLGSGFLRSAAFPIGFLFFAAPFPTPVTDWIMAGLQHGSAEVAYWLLQLSGMSVFREGTVFRLPGFTMEVAPQCSGIHSTLVLFITSFVGGYVLLKSNVARAVLIVAVFPLALLRNGLRILTIGQLCVQISPDMIDSWIHRRGGPVFFVLSLVPFFILLLSLRKWEGQPLTLPFLFKKPAPAPR